MLDAGLGTLGDYDGRMTTHVCSRFREGRVGISKSGIEWYMEERGNTSHDTTCVEDCFGWSRVTVIATTLNHFPIRKKANQLKSQRVNLILPLAFRLSLRWPFVRFVAVEVFFLRIKQISGKISIASVRLITGRSSILMLSGFSRSVFDEIHRTSRFKYRSRGRGVTCSPLWSYPQ